LARGKLEKRQQGKKEEEIPHDQVKTKLLAT